MKKIKHSKEKGLRLIMRKKFELDKEKEIWNQEKLSRLSEAAGRLEEPTTSLELNRESSENVINTEINQTDDE